MNSIVSSGRNNVPGCFACYTLVNHKHKLIQSLYNHMPAQCNEQAIAEQAVAQMEEEYAAVSAARLAVTKLQLEQMDRTGC